MKRTVLTLVLAGLLSLAGPATAHAGSVSLVTTPFSGTITDYTNVGTQSLPFTDTFGRTVTAADNASDIVSGEGLFFQPSSATDALSFTGLATGTTMAGISFEGGGLQFLTSVTFSNGDSFNVTPSLSPSLGFVGFADTTPFTSITFDFGGLPGESFIMTDFRTATSTVPEPATLTLQALAGLLVTAGAAAATWHRRRARRGARGG
jgi:hypothetical protein